MKKNNMKLLKMLSMFVVVISTSLFLKTVNAETMYAGDYVDKIYIKKVKGSMKKFLRSQWIHRSSDNMFVYCLEPWETIKEGALYNKSENYFNLSQETLKRVKLIAYYGYGYDNHEASHWYTITQMLIWKEIDKDADFYFTDRLNGERISLFEFEMQEILNLVNEHNVLPSFSNNSYTYSIKENIELNDQNNVLNKFDIIDDTLVKKVNNKLIVSSDEEKEIKVDLVKKANKYREIPFIYVSSDSQNVISVGRYDDIYTKVIFKFVSGSISLYKKDKEIDDNKFISLENAKYKLYNENKQEVGTFITDKNGYSKLNNLPLGKYYIKESLPSYGYVIDNQTYELNITIENLFNELIVYEEREEKEIKINKVYLENNNKKVESDVIFDIYKENEQTIYKTIKTDSNGNCNIKLPYGVYIFKQRNSLEGYSKVKDFVIKIDKTTPLVEYHYLIDKPIPKTIILPDTSSYDYSLVPLFILLIYSSFKGIFLRNEAK